MATNPEPEFASCLYFGQVMHQRFLPMEYHFTYGVMSIKVDVDQIAAEVKAVKGLSLNRFNLMSLHFKDYGARDGRAWRPWLEALLQNYGVMQPPAKIELVCFPRFLGKVFNPLAMWYAYDDNQALIAVVGEVSNTFGHWHHYVLTNQGLPLESKLRAKAQKVFHVSPFIGMDCEYRFRLQAPQKKYQLGIYQYENQQKILVATQSAKAQRLNTKNLLQGALKYPFNTLKVLSMIHWWALKIWLKGGRFHKTPEQQRIQPYGHTEMTKC